METWPTGVLDLPVGLAARAPNPVVAGAAVPGWAPKPVVVGVKPKKKKKKGNYIININELSNLNWTAYFGLFLHHLWGNIAHCFPLVTILRKNDGSNCHLHKYACSFSRRPNDQLLTNSFAQKSPTITVSKPRSTTFSSTSVCPPSGVWFDKSPKIRDASSSLLQSRKNIFSAKEDGTFIHAHGKKISLVVFWFKPTPIEPVLCTSINFFSEPHLSRPPLW